MAKPDGDGLRPIALIASFFRAWARVRQPLAKQWEEMHRTECFWGVRDKECDRAGYQHNLLSAYARIHDMSSATLFTDLHKFYERIAHSVLVREGMATSFEYRILAAACSLYSGPRILAFQGAVSEAFRVPGTVLAGCSLAMTLIK
eukprot:986170-Pyramimonas_sp.AAC.1